MGLPGEKGGDTRRKSESNLKETNLCMVQACLFVFLSQNGTWYHSNETDKYRCPLMRLLNDGREERHALLVQTTYTVVLFLRVEQQTIP